jgi:hypothetical protein
VHLGGLHRLRILVLEDTHVTLEGCNRLRKELPSCEPMLFNPMRPSPDP